jgi:hypothetical protein
MLELVELTCLIKKAQTEVPMASTGAEEHCWLLNRYFPFQDEINNPSHRLIFTVYRFYVNR